MFTNTILKSLAISAAFMSYLSILHAQKVDLDQKYLQVSYTALPTAPVLKDYKSYSTSLVLSSNISLSAQDTVLKNCMKMEGFRQDAEIWDFVVEISVDDYKLISKNVGSKTETVDAGNGKTMDKTTYAAQILYSMPTTYKLTLANGTKIAFYEAGTYEKPYVYNGDRTASYTDAQSQLNRALGDILSNARANVYFFLNKIHDEVNGKNGYVPTANKSEAYLWILDSKDHPDYIKYGQATQTTLTAFAAMDYQTPIATTLKLVQPALDYWTQKKEEIVIDGKKKLKS